jgi:hypothetical protein
MEIFLVGYGTLLYSKSLGNTIGQEAAQQKKVVPIMVHDYRRLFNLRPDHYEPSLMLTKEPIETAAMNVESAPGFAFNGLGFSVTHDELNALDKREIYYDRQAVPIYHFDTGEMIGEGHVYVVPLDSRRLNRDPKQLLPRFRDVAWARSGAYSIGDAFGRAFDETTYLADGKTLITELYGDRLENYTDADLR